VLEAQRAGEVGERALDCWRGGGLRGAAAATALERGRAAAAAALERGRGPSGSAGEGERRRAVGEASGSRKLEASGIRKQRRVLGFLMSLGLDRLGQPSQRLVDWKNQVAS
jgi:hypothetical protein